MIACYAAKKSDNSDRKSKLLYLFLSPYPKPKPVISVPLCKIYPKTKKFIDKTFEEKVEKWGKHETF